MQQGQNSAGCSPRLTLLALRRALFITLEHRAFSPSATIIASSVDYKVLGHSPPCKVRTLRRCVERFNNFLGTMRMNEKKGSMKRRLGPHLGMTSSPSRLK